MNLSTWISLWTNAAQEQLVAPVFVVGLVTVLCSWYLIRYFAPSFFLSSSLKKLTEHLKSVKDLPPPKRRKELEQQFSGHPLEHAWREYSETLHDQYAINNGSQQLLRSRATAGSANFFSSQSVVETPLRTEFYKHLPGILTGIGIVGTFFGLMLGLHHFDPSTPEKVNESVANLLNDVLLAFIGSFFSILASILVTLTEKWRLGRCYSHLETLTEMIDSLFDGGVGEEYLAELVKSSNESSIQTRQLKDSLVTDLREMLQNLVDSQVRENLKLTESISGAIENSLKQPMEAIADAMNKATGEQTGQVGDLLQDVLVAFMNKLEGTFGQQFKGLNEMMGQSVAAMQSMQQGFAGLIQEMSTVSESSSQNSAKMITQLLADMQAGQNNMQAGMNDMLSNLQKSIATIGAEGEGAGERMAKQLEKLFAESESRQLAMADNLQSFVDAIKESVGQGQQETMTKIAGSVDVLGQQLQSVFKQIEQGQSQMDQSTRASQAELHQGTRDLVGGLDEQVKILLQSVSDQHNATKNTLDVLSEQTEQHLKSMQLGADKMKVAAERFETAGNSVTKAVESTADVFDSMQGVGVELVGAARELNSVVVDYRNNREALNKTLAVIEGVVAGAQVEASSRTQFIQDLKQQSDRMKAINQEATEYLEQISGVLGKGFNEFSIGMENSLRQTLGSLDAELHKAVTSLAGGVEGVKESLDDFSDVIERVRR